MAKRVSYKTSGVDINKADRFVKSIKGVTSSTFNRSVIKRKGAFASLYETSKNQVLVSSTDGVGTKLLLANQLNKHNTVGIDLVAMNVNDILCVGAKPLFFLDYIACGKLDKKVLKSVVSGIVKGCKESGSSLVGGETAEMPGMYKDKDYDLAGFSIGIVDKKKIIDGSTIKKGDVLIGLASSGPHSNGYSLIRKVFSLRELKKYSRELLAPTRIYVKPVLKLLSKYKVKGIAHITGGAYYDKLTKILPKGKCFKINRGSWPIPKIFQNIQKKGKISESEMFRTFNMGIGLVLVVDRNKADLILSFLKRQKVRSYKIGEVITDKRRKIIL